MKKLNIISVIGGDKRQLFVADYFRNKGKNVLTYGLSENKNNENESLLSVINKSEAIILPLPLTKDGKKIYSFSSMKESVDDVAGVLKSDQLVFAGMLNNSTMNKLLKNNPKVFDYFRRDEVSILNCIPTVQGILKTIFDNIDFTVHSSNCAVFGYGKTAKLTATTLKALGANVTVCVRKYSDIAVAYSNGISGCFINDFHRIANSFDIIVNTVPAPVINREILKALSHNTLIIDVASAPYGTDFASAEEFGIKALQCPSLPGKTAPKTAGEIIAAGIMNIMKEEGYE